MINDLARIRTDSILVDASLLLAAIFTEGWTNAVAEECSEFLRHCAKKNILIQVTPETCLLLWKAVSSSYTKQSEKPQSPIQDPLIRSAKRVHAFLKGPVDLLCLTPDIMSQATDLWLEKQGVPSIEACVAMCALRATHPSPYFIATVNDHYDSFEAYDVVIMKPSP